MRPWLRRYERGVLAPLVSWTAPAILAEGFLLRPSVAHCWHRSPVSHMPKQQATG